MYYIGFCRICKTGPVGVRTCGACEAISLVCDECDSVWASPDLSAVPTTARGETLPCPTCDASLFAPGAHWSTRPEIASRAWLETAINEGRVNLKEGPPLASPPGDQQAAQ